jgi:predicted ATPase
MGVSSSGRAPTMNLPAELTSFVGRRQELDEVKRLLSVSRLVTLAGVGGAGKTRLALRVAADRRRAFPDGVWCVELAKLRDPELLVDTVADTLGLREQSTRPALAMLSDYLASRQLLLVLDNCEHLVDAAAALVSGLLRECPDVRVLATSREPLRINGETTLFVPPLSLPDPKQSHPLGGLAAFEAITLFSARALAVAPDFRLTEDNYVAVARLCRRLDGLPLAIELAAVLMRVLSPEQVLERLNDRYRLLTGGSRNAPDRQQTLRASIEWSHELCSGPERSLWSRLSVFSGGFELDAVEGICSGEDLPSFAVLDIVASLVDKSILLRSDQDGVVRYELLETLREYGQEQLKESGEYPAVRRRHRDWYQQLVGQAAAEWISDRQEYHFTRLDREHPNIQVALDFCITEPGEAEVALRIAVDLFHFYWWGRGWGSEGRHWLGHALEKATEPSAIRAQALLQESMLTMSRGDLATAKLLLAEGSDLAQQLGDPAGLALGGWASGNASQYGGDVPTAIATFEQALAIVSSPADLPLRLDLLLSLSIAASVAGDAQRATRCHDEVMAITEPAGECFHRAYSLWALGMMVHRQGDLSRAASLLHQSLRLRQGLDDRTGTAWSIESLAWVEAADHRSERAATLLGAADQRWKTMGTPVQAFLHLVPYHDEAERQSRAALGDQAFEAAFSRGSELEDAVAYALD